MQRQRDRGANHEDSGLTILTPRRTMGPSERENTSKRQASDIGHTSAARAKSRVSSDIRYTTTLGDSFVLPAPFLVEVEGAPLKENLFPGKLA